MSYKIEAGQTFTRQVKFLAKKYASIKAELAALSESLANDPTQGTPIGRDCYKIRLAIKSKGRGKRGGARVITCVVAVTEKVVLLSIYDKADRDTISDNDLLAILGEEKLR